MGSLLVSTKYIFIWIWEVPIMILSSVSSLPPIGMFFIIIIYMKVMMIIDMTMIIYRRVTGIQSDSNTFWPPPRIHHPLSSNIEIITIDIV